MTRTRIQFDAKHARSLYTVSAKSLQPKIKHFNQYSIVVSVDCSDSISEQTKLCRLFVCVHVNDDKTLKSNMYHYYYCHLTQVVGYVKLTSCQKRHTLTYPHDVRPSEYTNYAGLPVVSWAIHIQEMIERTADKIGILFWNEIQERMVRINLERAFKVKCWNVSTEKFKIVFLWAILVATRNAKLHWYLCDFLFWIWFHGIRLYRNSMLWARSTHNTHSIRISAARKTSNRVTIFVFVNGFEFRLCAVIKNRSNDIIIMEISYAPI